ASPHGNLQGRGAYGRDMPKLRIEIAATDQIEAKRVQSVYQRGERVVTLDDEATDETWRAGYTPVGRPIFVGLTNGEPISYRFDVPVDTSARSPPLIPDRHVEKPRNGEPPSGPDSPQYESGHEGIVRIDLEVRARDPVRGARDDRHDSLGCVLEHPGEEARADDRLVDECLRRGELG